MVCMSGLRLNDTFTCTVSSVSASIDGDFLNVSTDIVSAVL